MIVALCTQLGFQCIGFYPAFLECGLRFRQAGLEETRGSMLPSLCGPGMLQIRLNLVTLCDNHPYLVVCGPCGSSEVSQLRSQPCDRLLLLLDFALYRRLSRESALLVDAGKPGLFGLQLANLISQRFDGCFGMANVCRTILLHPLRVAFQCQQVLLILLNALFTRANFTLGATDRAFERTQTSSKL